MKTSKFKEKLHRYIESAGQKKLKAIYTMVEEEIDERQLIPGKIKILLRN